MAIISNVGELKVYNYVLTCDTSCLTCLGETDQDCTSCQSPKLLTGATVGACVQCQSDQYLSTATSTYVCTDCDSSCLTCSGGGIDQCQSCSGTDFIDRASIGACQDECTSNQYFKNTVEPFTCVDCHSDCLTCSGDGDNNCMTCFGSKQLTKAVGPTTCIDCLSDQFFDNSGPTFICSDCDSSCLTCSGSEETECTSCTSPNILYQNQSPSSCTLCLSDEYLDTSTATHTCNSCHESCLTCNQAGSNQCASCDIQSLGNYLLENNECTVCSTQKYKHTDSSNSLSCKTCDISCSNCSGPGNSNCDSCSTDYFTKNGRCITECEANHSYNDNEVCTPCPNECLNGCSDYTQACILPEEESENNKLLILFEQILDNNGFTVLKAFIKHEGQIVTSSIIYSSNSLITFKSLNNTGLNISSELEINQAISLAIVRINSSVFSDNIEYLKIEPFISQDEYFTLNGIKMETEFQEAILKLQNLQYSQSITGLSEVGKILSKRSNEIKGAAGIVGLIPFPQSLTFARFLQRIELFTNLRYVNVDFGKEVETVMDSLAGDQYIPRSVKVQTTYQEEISKKFSRGKLTSKKVPLFMGNYKVAQISVYVFSFLFQLSSKLLVKIKSKNDFLFKLIIYLVYYSRKLHLVIINLVILNLTFFGLRIVLHVNYSSLQDIDFFKYMIILVGLLIFLFDIHRIINVSITLGNLMAVKKFREEKNKKMNIIDPFFGTMSQENKIKVADLNPKNQKMKMQIDREKTLFMLKINHPIRNYLLNSINGSKEKIPDQIFYTSSSQFLKMLCFSFCIITLQNLPILCLLILIMIEFIVFITNIGAIVQLTIIKNNVLMGIRILESCLLIPFLFYYLFINILGFSSPTGYTSLLMVTLFLVTIILETLHIIIIHLVLIFNLISSILNNKGKKFKKSNLNRGKESQYDELTNKIIYYKPLKQNGQLKSPLKSKILNRNSILNGNRKRFQKNKPINKISSQARFRIRLNNNQNMISMSVKQTKNKIKRIIENGECRGLAMMKTKIMKKSIKSNFNCDN